MSLPTSLCQPETVLPEQFFDVKRPPLNGETALMLAVLKDAVEAFQKNAHAHEPARRVLFEEAREYLESDDTEYPFSVTNICDVLGIEVGYLRRGLKQFYNKHKPGRVKRRAKIMSLTKRRKVECCDD